MLSSAGTASPSQAGVRAAAWPTTRESLAGLQLDSSAVQLCKQFLLQVGRAASFLESGWRGSGFSGS